MRNRPRQFKDRTCLHLRVNINAIVAAFDPRLRYRKTAGDCQDCGKRVERAEAKSGLPLHNWR